MFNNRGLWIDGARSDAMRITSESRASQYSFGDEERIVTASIELSGGVSLSAQYLRAGSMSDRALRQSMTPYDGK